MAYMYDGNGPYPDKAGEFCGDYPTNWSEANIIPMNGQTRVEAIERHREWFAQMRFGKPSASGGESSKEWAAKGYVGLYLKEDAPFHPSHTSIETDVLTEDVVSTVGVTP